MKALILGGRDIVLSFKAIGVDGKVVSTPEETVLELNKLSSSGDYAVIMVEEAMAIPIELKVNELRKKGITIVEVPAPSTKGESKDFEEFLKKTLGITI